MSITSQSGSSNPVGDILVAVPEFHGLHISTRNEVANFVERKLKKFTLKLKASPYAPNSQLDPLGINSNFNMGLRNWLLQFPDKHRLGFLAAALSTIYITDEEIDSFIDIGLSRLREQMIEVAEMDDRQSGTKAIVEWATLKDNIRCYAVSEFGAYEKVIRRLQFTGSRDRAKHPIRGIVDEFVKAAFHDLRVLADKDLQTLIYREEAGQRAAELIRSLRNSHIVLVEDGTFSGKRIKREASRFLRLMNILFSGFETQMSLHGYKRPWVYLLAVFGTNDALEAVQELGALGGPDRVSSRFIPVFGHMFDRDASVNPGPPPAVEELTALTQKADCRKKLKLAVQFFHEQYSHKYWDRETDIRTMLKLDNKDIPYGLGGKGWTLLTHVNCPNDSLPLLWYPHIGSESFSIRALFPRLESQVEGESMHELQESIEIVSRDQARHLHDFLAEVHKEP